jgi:hypothetical protein
MSTGTTINAKAAEAADFFNAETAESAEKFTFLLELCVHFAVISR